MAPENDPKVTYWYHPESDAFFISPADDPREWLDDGHSIEIDEYKYITGIIDQIEKDPEHKLPEGITAVVRRAYRWNQGGLSGEIFYDSHKRFVDGYCINVSKVVCIEPGGIYCTMNNKYLVEMIDPNAPQNKVIHG